MVICPETLIDPTVFVCSVIHGSILFFLSENKQISNAIHVMRRFCHHTVKFSSYFTCTFTLALESWCYSKYSNFSVKFTVSRRRKKIPVLKPSPEAATLPSLYIFHDPALFSHVKQMWCHWPSFADTAVGLMKY